MPATLIHLRLVRTSGSCQPWNLSCAWCKLCLEKEEKSKHNQHPFNQFTIYIPLFTQFIYTISIPSISSQFIYLSLCSTYIQSASLQSVHNLYTSLYAVHIYNQHPFNQFTIYIPLFMQYILYNQHPFNQFTIYIPLFTQYIYTISIPSISSQFIYLSLRSTYIQ